MLRPLFSLLALTGALGSVAGEPIAEPPDFSHAEFATILHATVDAERIDYQAVRDRHSAALNRYLDRLAEYDPSGLDASRRLALYINLYNATMIRAVLDRYSADYSPSDDEFSVFKTPLVRLNGKRLTLDALEHEIVRKRFDEPRIHVALVCGAESCPPLLPRAYDASDLDATLEANMRRFINDPTRNRIDHAHRTLHLSSLFDWFADDFGGRDQLTAYVNRYTERDVSSYAVKFLEYSWRLNDTAAPKR